MNSATFSVFANDFVARNIRFVVRIPSPPLILLSTANAKIHKKQQRKKKNATHAVKTTNSFKDGSGSIVQAVAALVGGDRNSFHDCAFIGYQDTLSLFFICNLRYQTTYVEDGNFGAGSNTTGRVSWLKSLSPEQLQGFLDIGFLGLDRWLDKQP
ncbi:hypothetical protein GW17_00037357 [Ensete ventricosum]|nr:hypothetical protein GW17_00037357 [Ensete ventricosum]